MLKITLVAMGKLKERAFLELEQEYLKRMAPMAKMDIIELPEEGYGKECEAGKARQSEALKIQKFLKPGSFVVALDEKGQAADTVSFAKRLTDLERTGQEAVFVIGSSSGLDESIKGKANWRLSLSPMTFTHNFARVLLIEQLYRVCTILSGKIYHK